MSQRTSLCKHCGAEFVVKGKRGRPPKYCKASCRQNAYVRRKALENEAGVEAYLMSHGQACTYCDNNLAPRYFWVDLRTMKPFCGDCYRQLQQEELKRQA